MPLLEINNVSKRFGGLLADQRRHLFSAKRGR